MCAVTVTVFRVSGRDSGLCNNIWAAETAVLKNNSSAALESKDEEEEEDDEDEIFNILVEIESVQCVSGNWKLIFLLVEGLLIC
ncbi:hypothetical protein QVD17_05830 [Tagetes erecta]|uniref:Uncharacterized protein n=1 Tax=Tagetes erecta TaxID=13708 RepID=A0AAD8LMB5_TARER|nr:hypothetical protein QVD17_05830 [Tagetes erecta]